MKYKKIILAGGNGYIGRVLADHFKPLADEIIILSRKSVAAVGNVKTLVWNGHIQGEWVTALQGADLLVNLCGKNVNCRYTKKNKQELFDSRLMPTVLLNKVIASMDNPPKLFINFVSATIYRHAEDRPQDEDTGEIGTGFSVNLCQAWEKTFFETHTPQTRKVALRTSFVLGASDSAFPRLLNMVRFGLGGPQGNGEQYVSWIHEKDVARIVEWLTDHPEVTGVLNCTAPNPVKNKVVMHSIRQAIRMPFSLPSPVWLLGIGALLIGTETELILKSRWVLPGRLTDLGFQFKYPEINEAVKACIN